MKKIAIIKIRQNPYIYFLFKLVIFFALIFVIDFSAGNILRYFYFRQESGEQYRTTLSIEKTKADLLIFGSSRANHHYDPNVFEKRLNNTFYNVGRDGSGILYHYAILKGILKRYTPKIIILDLNIDEFRYKTESYDRLSALLPYYKSHQEMRSVIELKSKFEKLKLLSNIYPYNSSIFTIAIGNTSYNKTRRVDFKGYVPLKKIWNQSIQIDGSLSNYEIDSIKIKTYETFIQDCIQSNVKLYIVCSPVFVKFPRTQYSIKIGQKIAKEYNIKFYNYTNNPVFIDNPKLFCDVSHLNENGAKQFSSFFLDDLLKINK
jgi:hypothetical protein